MIGGYFQLEKQMNKRKRKAKKSKEKERMENNQNLRAKLYILKGN